jgi:HNH endonuclease.
MQREKLFDRDVFSYDEKAEIARKSNNRCCHCGRTVFTGYGATVDHFVPLHKGGTNRNINLIMLCEDCNKEKDDKIMDVSYCKYLKDKYKQELDGYLNSYIISFDYINRNCMFACDEYSILLLQERNYVMTRKNKKLAKKYDQLGTKYLFKKAFWSDFDKLCEYFKKYCKKYDCFGSDDAVKINISFWLQFGCIYYIERQGEIVLMNVFTIKHVTEMDRYQDFEYVLNMYCFSYYSSENAFGLVVNSVTELSRFILAEQRLGFLPVNFLMLKDDKLFSAVVAYLTKGSFKVNEAINGFSAVPCIVLSKEKWKTSQNGKEPGLESITEEDSRKLVKFFNHFSACNTSVAEYFKSNPDSMWADWMLYDIFSPEDIENLGIITEESPVWNYNN